MANIKLITPEIGNVGSSSGAYKIRFATTEQIQSYAINLISSKSGIIQDNTTLYLENDNYDSEYKYLYKLFIYYDENRSINYSYINYTYRILAFFVDDNKVIEGKIQQSGNPNAPYIKNIMVYNANGELLERDEFNRWVIPNSYTEGSKFTITYDKSYPSHENMWVSNVNVTNEVGGDFIDNIYIKTPNSSEFTINDVISNGTVEVEIEFDDSIYYSGAATTYVLFTRNGIIPPRIIIDRTDFKDITWERSEAATNVSFTNINKSDITVSYSADWLNAYIADDMGDYTLRIYIEPNNDIKRSAVITLSGTNQDGLFASNTVNVTQSSKERPYIGDAYETYTLFDETVIPVIRCDYKGNVYEPTSKFTLYNWLNSQGEETIDNLVFYINNEPTDFITLEINGGRNAIIKTKSFYQENFGDYELHSNITVYMELADGTILEPYIMIIIEPSPENIYSPIWKDIYFECPKKYFRFRNINTNEIIYNGIIYNQITNKVKINDILKSYIMMNKNPFENTVTLNSQMISVLVETSSTPNFEYFDEEKIYHLYWNYSYDYNAPEEIMSGYTTGYFGLHAGIDIDANFANPIEYYDSRQYIFVNDGQGYKYYNQTNSQVLGDSGVVLAQIPKNYFRGDILTFAVKPGNNSYIKYHIDQPIGEDEDHDYTWDCGYLKCTNADYAVYYKNSYGIWCWMLFEGKQFESLKTTQNKYLVDNGNFNPFNIHNAVYNSNVEEYYNLTSVHLSDEQSKKLKDLYTSPLIYVHDLNQDVVYNCILDTTTYDIKSFRNQGRKFFTHTIKLKKSINKNILV